MTVSYNLDMSTSTSGSFLRILFRWRGSVWKSVLNELIVWTAMFYTVFAIYRFVLSEDEQKAFESVAKHVNERMDLLPLHFILGFFVTIIIDRWKQIFQNIGFVDSAAYFICTYIRGTDYEILLARRNCIRYLCLTQVLVLRDISIQVRKRFPNIDSLIDSGLIKQNEREMMDKVRNGFSKYWMPIHWTFSICHEMRLKGNIAADVLLNSMLQEIKLFREKLQMLCNYDWVPVPLAYPQVVFLAVRIYFLLCLFCRQYRWHENADTQNQVDRVLPIMTMLQFFFIMGWLKVAEALLNPLGEDDDDYEFECNYIIDRNIAIAMTMVDECFDQKPKQMHGDSTDDDGDAKELLAYSESAVTLPQHPLVGSATMSNLPQEKQHIRMVHRQPSQMDGNELNENSMASASPSPAAMLHRPTSNVLFRRMSSISLGKLRAIRQSISLPIRRGGKEKSGGGRVGGIDEKNATAIKGWSMDFGDGKSIVEIDANGQQKFPIDEKRRNNLPGIHTIATAPELRRQHSIPSPLVEVRSLQLRHLEPLSEEKDILPDEFNELAGINLPQLTAEFYLSSQENGKK